MVRHLVVGGRGSGKTTRMLEAVRRDRDAVLVVASQEEYGDLISHGGAPIERTHVAPLNGRGLPPHGLTGVAYVDDAERVLGELLGMRVEAVSLTFEGFRYAPVFDGAAVDERLAAAGRYRLALERLAELDARSPRGKIIAREALD